MTTFEQRKHNVLVLLATIGFMAVVTALAIGVDRLLVVAR